MSLSTGLPSLDKILNGIMAGDNIVWQVDSIDDYLPFVESFSTYAQTYNKKLVYFRFAQHRELLSRDSGAHICQLNPQSGFETFINTIHDVIRQTGQDGYFVFDSLSTFTPSVSWGGFTYEFNLKAFFSYLVFNLFFFFLWSQLKPYRDRRIIWFL